MLIADRLFATDGMCAKRKPTGRRCNEGDEMLYVNLKKNVQMTPHTDVKIADVCELYDSTRKDLSNITKIKLGRVEEDMILITNVDIARAIQDDNANIMGSDACSVMPVSKQSSGIILFFKTLLVSVVLFFGAGLTIMNYHSDVDMPKVHHVLSTIFTGSPDFSHWISITYSVGIGAGVLFFANLLPGKKAQPSIFEIEQMEMDKQVEQFLSNKAEQEK